MKTLNKNEENSLEAWVSIIWYNGDMSWITDIITSLNNAGNGSADFPSTKCKAFKRFFSKTIKRHERVVK